MKFNQDLTVVHDDSNNFSEELLVSCNGISIHQKHLQLLTIEVYKSLLNLTSEFVWPSVKTNVDAYNLRNGNICILHPTRSSHYDINSVQFRISLL